MSVLDVAAAHLLRQRARAKKAAKEAARLWSAVDKNNIAPSWRALVPGMYAVLYGAQEDAADAAVPYLTELLGLYGLDGGAEADLVPSGFSGSASDGRDMVSLLYQPAITALTTIQKGGTPARGMAAGRFVLDMVVRTQVADAGRTADGVALVARPQLKGWVRMLSTPSCSRCIILGGKTYRWNAGFKRHPRCDCRHIPANEDVAGDLRTDPKAQFNAMTAAEQDRAFGAAEAQAIRDGADMNRVVNSGRGMFTAGGKQYTHEAAGRRPRITPEQIYLEADGDRDEAIRLLKLHKYLS
jgi:hypothetical protein